MGSRLDALRDLVAKNPKNAVARFGLANELMKAGEWEEAREQLERYLAAAQDEGNAYGRLAETLERLGRVAEARDALRRGIAAAERFGHPSMAQEFEERLDALGA